MSELGLTDSAIYLTNTSSPDSQTNALIRYQINDLVFEIAGTLEYMRGIQKNRSRLSGNGPSIAEQYSQMLYLLTEIK